MLRIINENLDLVYSVLTVRHDLTVVLFRLSRIQIDALIEILSNFSLPFDDQRLRLWIIEDIYHIDISKKLMNFVGLLIFKC